MLPLDLKLPSALHALPSVYALSSRIECRRIECLRDQIICPFLAKIFMSSSPSLKVGQMLFLIQLPQVLALLSFENELQLSVVLGKAHMGQVHGEYPCKNKAQDTCHSNPLGSHIAKCNCGKRGKHFA